jgi:hypothetical protein
MQQAAEKCEMAQLELKSSATYLAIKGYQYHQRTKIGKVTNLA